MAQIKETVKHLRAVADALEEIAPDFPGLMWFGVATSMPNKRILNQPADYDHGDSCAWTFDSDNIGRATAIWIGTDDVGAVYEHAPLPPITVMRLRKIVVGCGSKRKRDRLVQIVGRLPIGLRMDIYRRFIETRRNEQAIKRAEIERARQHLERLELEG